MSDDKISPAMKDGQLSPETKKLLLKLLENGNVLPTSKKCNSPLNTDGSVYMQNPQGTVAVTKDTDGSVGITLRENGTAQGYIYAGKAGVSGSNMDFHADEKLRKEIQAAVSKAEIDCNFAPAEKLADEVIKPLVPEKQKSSDPSQGWIVG